MTPFVILDFLISQNDGDTLYVEKETPIDILKEAVLRGFQIRLNLPLESYFLPLLNCNDFREKLFPGSGFSWRCEGYAKGAGFGNGDYYDFERMGNFVGSGVSPGTPNVFPENKGTWEEDPCFPLTLSPLYISSIDFLIAQQPG